jgi:hypothetical protein
MHPSEEIKPIYAQDPGFGCNVGILLCVEADLLLSRKEGRYVSHLSLSLILIYSLHLFSLALEETLLPSEAQVPFETPLFIAMEEQMKSPFGLTHLRSLSGYEFAFIA